MRAEFIDEPFECKIKDGNFVVAWPDGSKLSMPLRVARENLARCQKALAAYDSRKADVVPLRGKRKEEDG